MLYTSFLMGFRALPFYCHLLIGAQVDLCLPPLESTRTTIALTTCTETSYGYGPRRSCCPVHLLFPFPLSFFFSLFLFLIFFFFLNVWGGDGVRESRPRSRSRKKGTCSWERILWNSVGKCTTTSLAGSSGGCNSSRG